MSKREFGKMYLVYSGIVIGGGQIKVDPSKLEVILNWPRPRTITDVRSFLGIVQYWGKFIANFSYISSKLHALTSVKKVFQWGGKKQDAFKTLKEKLSTSLVLDLLDLKQPFEIQIDAVRYAMGAILMQ